MVILGITRRFMRRNVRTTLEGHNHGFELTETYLRLEKSTTFWKSLSVYPKLYATISLSVNDSSISPFQVTKSRFQVTCKNIFKFPWPSKVYELSFTTFWSNFRISWRSWSYFPCTPAHPQTNLLGLMLSVANPHKLIPSVFHSLLVMSLIFGG